MAKLLSLTYVLLSFVSTSAVSTECQDGKCDSANDGDAGVLLQGRVRVSPERKSIPKVFLTFPMKSIPHGPALLQMKHATENNTFCFTTTASTSAESKADGAEIIEHAVYANGTGGLELKIYSNKTVEPGVYCCPGKPSFTRSDDLVEEKCANHGTAPSLMQAKMMIQASSVAEDGEAVDQIAQLAKQSPNDVAFVIDNERVYNAVLNELGDHVARGKIFMLPWSNPTFKFVMGGLGFVYSTGMLDPFLGGTGAASYNNQDKVGEYWGHFWR